MISTLTRTSPLAGTACTAGELAMEKRSTTAPGYRSGHGTGLPFAGMTSVSTPVSNTARTAVQLDALPGSPPRGGPV